MKENLSLCLMKIDVKIFKKYQQIATSCIKDISWLSVVHLKNSKIFNIFKCLKCENQCNSPYCRIKEKNNMIITKHAQKH